MRPDTPPMYGNISLLVVFTSMTAWAGLTELDRTVTAQGHFIPQARNQVVQVVDGGVLQTLHVKEGDRVRAGQTLATLEAVRADAALDELRAQWSNLKATQMRADAFAQGQTSLPPAARFGGQPALFEQQLQALNRDLAAFDDAIALAQREIDISEALFKAGDISQTDVMRAQRSLIELRQRRQSLLDNQRTEARREAARLQVELDVINSRLLERQNIRAHTTLTAPTDGQVQLVKAHTLGAVLRGGDELLHINPSGSPLMVEAKLNPADMADLTIGLPTRVRVDAWDFAQYGALSGTIAHISPDTVSEPTPTGQPMTYYKVHISIDPVQVNQKLNISDIKPGMTTLLDIQTGERSLLSYLLGPVAKGLNTALREK